MHIVICNERLLFRFGLDRALILMGRHLREAGHRITVLVSRYDQDSVEGWANLVRVLPEAADYIQSNEAAKDGIVPSVSARTRKCSAACLRCNGLGSSDAITCAPFTGPFCAIDDRVSTEKAA